MIRQGKILLAAGLLAVGTWSCFDDPTSDLRGGASQLSLDRTAVTVVLDSSVAILAYVKDQQGNALPIGSVTWTSSNPALVEVSPDTVNLTPGLTSARAFITGVSNAPGVAVVTASAGGFTDTVRVTVVPKNFEGTATVTGTAGADTIITKRPPPAAPDTLVFTAGDTVVVTVAAPLSFSTTSSGVTLGVSSAMILSRTATEIKALARAPYSGPVTVTNITYAGTAETGPIAIPSLTTTASVNVQRARFYGTASVAASPDFGPNTLVTVNAPANMTFDSLTTAGVGGVPAGLDLAVAPDNIVILSRTSTSLTGIIGDTASGTVIVRGALFGSARVDSVRMGALASGVTVNKASFPGSFTEASTNMQLDTIVVSSGSASFCTGSTAPCTGASQIQIAGVNARVISRTATTMTVLPWTYSNGSLTVTNSVVAGALLSSLTTAANLAMSSTGEPNEPGNQSSATATAIAGLGALDDTVTVWGFMNASTDARDYYTFTMPVAGAVEVNLAFFGNGSGSSDANPDLDVVVCTDTTLSGTGVCGYSQDILGNLASVTNQPEAATSPEIGASRVVYIRTYAYYATANGNGLYRLRVVLKAP